MAKGALFSGIAHTAHIHYNKKLNCIYIKRQINGVFFCLQGPIYPLHGDCDEMRKLVDNGSPILF